MRKVHVTGAKASLSGTPLRHMPSQTSENWSCSDSGSENMIEVSDSRAPVCNGLHSLGGQLCVNGG